MVTELQPLRPRRSSAATVRHHRKYLGFRLERVAPGARTVHVTPIQVERGWAFRVLALDAARRPVRLRPVERDGQRVSGQQRAADLLRGAFPAADWAVAHTWRADRPNQLTDNTPALPEEATR